MTLITVSPSGSIKAAITQARPGDTIEVRGGTYDEDIQITPPAGTATGRITLQAKAGERVVGRGLLWLKNPHYWTIKGINWTWREGAGSSNHMIKLNGGDSWVFQDAEVWGAKSYAAILVYGDATLHPQNWKLVGVHAHDTISSHGAGSGMDNVVYINSGPLPTNGVIDNCLFHGAVDGAALKIGGPDAGTAGPDTILVKNTTMWDAFDPFRPCWKTRNVWLENCAIGGPLANRKPIRGYQMAYPSSIFVTNSIAYGGSQVQTTDGGVVVLENTAYPVNPQWSGLYVPTNPAAIGKGYTAGAVVTPPPPPPPPPPPDTDAETIAALRAEVASLKIDVADLDTGLAVAQDDVTALTAALERIRVEAVDALAALGS